MDPFAIHQKQPPRAGGGSILYRALGQRANYFPREDYGTVGNGGGSAGGVEDLEGVGGEPVIGAAGVQDQDVNGRLEDELFAEPEDSLGLGVLEVVHGEHVVCGTERI